MQASVPEFTMRTISTEGTIPQISSAISTSMSVGAPKLVPRSRTSARASITTGGRWPRISGPQEPT